MRPSYLYDGNSYAGNTLFLNRDSPKSDIQLDCMHQNMIQVF